MVHGSFPGDVKNVVKDLDIELEHLKTRDIGIKVDMSGRFPDSCGSILREVVIKVFDDGGEGMNHIADEIERGRHFLGEMKVVYKLTYNYRLGQDVAPT